MVAKFQVSHNRIHGGTPRNVNCHSDVQRKESALYGCDQVMGAALVPLFGNDVAEMR